MRRLAVNRRRRKHLHTGLRALGVVVVHGRAYDVLLWWRIHTTFGWVVAKADSRDGERDPVGEREDALLRELNRVTVPTCCTLASA